LRRCISMLVLLRKFLSTVSLNSWDSADARGRDARALVDELEFVWDQIKNNSTSSSSSSPGRRGGVPSYTTQPRTFQQPLSGGDGPMRVLSPMSQDDEAEAESQRRLGYNDEYDDNNEYNDGEKKGDKRTKTWRRTVEQALVKMTAEIAALREQIATGREYQGKRRRSLGRWVGWLIWAAIRHFLVNAVVLGIVLLWLRKRKDRRVEDLVREGLKIGREYVRKILPAR
jgi:hypothetical protein